MLATVIATHVLALTTAICTTGSTRTCKLDGCPDASQLCLADRTWGLCTCASTTCNDYNRCTVDEWTGTECLYTPLPAGTPCSNGDPCDGAEICDATARCLATSPDIGDGDPCTADSCDPVLGVQYVPVANCTNTPPDPATVATPLSATAVTSFLDSIRFLYTGSNRIQFGVSPDAVDERRAAVVRGKAITPDGVAVQGARVAVPGSDELGYTYTRADGGFDLVVNGGRAIRVQITKSGLLPVHRTVKIAWNEYVSVPDAVLLAADAVVTRVSSGVATAQVARGSRVTDSAGARQATVYFPPNTSAGMTTPTGTSQPLATLDIRLTEYTATPHGSKAMPGELPPRTAFTYAVEMGVDEAVAGGATEVTFSQPVAFYVDNFLGFPVGGRVPTGYFDRQKGVWVPSNDGRIIKVLSVTGGVAALDIDGSGTAAGTTPLASLGISATELAEIGKTYAAGQELWRVQVSHFSPWDCNWPYGCDDADGDGRPDCEPPRPPPPEKDQDDCNSTLSGSIIECQSQVLGEEVPVVGTSQKLHYRSSRVPGHGAANALDIPVVGERVPTGLRRIDVETSVAGRTFKYSVPPPYTPWQKFAFAWDGLDAYGRMVRGRSAAYVKIGYVYDTVYLQPSDRNGPMSFGALSVSGVPFTASRSGREPVTIYASWVMPIGNFEMGAAGLGGWSLTDHHAYDPIGHVLQLGSGYRRNAKALPKIISTVAGGGTSTADNVPATQASLSPSAIAIAADGSLFIADSTRVRRVDPTGTIATIAGAMDSCRERGEGALAVGTCIGAQDVALDADGTLYIADFHRAGTKYVGRVLKVDAEGIVHVVAGTGQPGNTGDGGPALQATVTPLSLAFGPDGGLYVLNTLTPSTTSDGCAVRAIDPTGTITRIAGTGTCVSTPIGPTTRALDVGWRRAQKIAVGPDGSIYLPDYDPTMNRLSPYLRVIKVASDGRAVLFAGNNDSSRSGDGGPAELAGIGWVFGIEVGPDGSVYLGEGNHVWASAPYDDFIRRVRVDGTIVTEVGARGSYAGDGLPALQVAIGAPVDIAIAPDGAMYIVTNSRVQKVTIPVPPMLGAEIVVASPSGDEIYVFDGEGRHMRTLDPRTNVVLRSFTYDTAGFLATITDRDGNVMRIERASGGAPTAIVGAFGQRTTLSVDGNGFLTAVTNPAGESILLAHDVGGLLRTMTDARRYQHVFDYDLRGRLVSDANPAGGLKALARQELSHGHAVSVDSAFDATTWLRFDYVIEELSNGDRRTIDFAPDGTTTTTVRSASGTTSVMAPDGVVVSTTVTPDPRFGLQSPVSSSMTKTPAGLTRNVVQSRAATLADPTNLLSAIGLTETTTVNGRAWVRSYDATSRQQRLTTPANRSEVSTWDERGRLTRLEPFGYPATYAITFGYDAAGRVERISQGTRTTTITYNGAGYPDMVTDPANQQHVFGYDLAGRVIESNLLGAGVTRIGYDADGNVTSVAPPERPAHGFVFDPMDRVQIYSQPPLVGIANTSTAYDYYLDGSLGSIVPPDGNSIAISYERDVSGQPTGRVSGITTWHMTTSAAYDTAGRVQTLGTTEGVLHTYAYDGFLLKSDIVSGPVSGSILFGYDNDLRPSSISVDGATASLEYDADGLLTRAGTLTIGREAATGRVTGTALGATTTAQTYSGHGELDHFEASANGAGLYSYDLSRDLAGRIESRTEILGGVATNYGYAYDEAGRLKSATIDGRLVSSYSYDANGNRLSATTAQGQELAVHDDQDRLLTQGATTYTYGANGDLSTKTIGTQMTTYAYDPLGNLVGVALPDGRQLSYLTDGANRRVGKMVNGALVEGFLYDGPLRPVAWLDGVGNVKAMFVYGLRVNVPEYMVTAAGTFRLVTDHLGSPRLVIDTTSGAIAQRIDYDEWGNVLQDTAPGFQPFGFAGGVYDRDTGLVKFGARDYDPRAGRWTSKDPLRFAAGETNAYGYVQNDPVTLVDPLGLWRWPGGIYNDAMADAHSRFPRNTWHNGPGDAYRHCFASCLMTMENSTFEASLYGEINEMVGDWTHKQESGERQMDDHNNSEGRQCGRKAKTRQDCVDGCLNAPLIHSYIPGSTPPYSFY